MVLVGPHSVNCSKKLSRLIKTTVFPNAFKKSISVVEKSDFNRQPLVAGVCFVCCNRSRTGWWNVKLDKLKLKLWDFFGCDTNKFLEHCY